TDIKLHKSAKSILTKPLKSENPEDFKQKRKNKNLSKLKKYKKRQLKKKHSSKQITNERKIIKTFNEIQEEALNYLRIWHEDYENWKFKKLLQSWLIKNALNRKMTDIKLHKSAKSILTKPLKSENPEDFKQKRKNKNLSKLKKYKKRQLKKKHSSKQITNERKIIKTFNEIQEEALNYLRIWHEDYENWKFKKLLQSWLIKNALNRKMVPSSEFRIFKQYIKGLVGCARQNLLNQCSKIIEEQTDGLEKCTEL
ncbi:uncharacterized protein DC041_0007573, partial [Schistosoma bovis]